MKRKSFSSVLHTFKRTTFLLIAAFSCVLAWALTADASDAMLQVKNENTYEPNLIKFKRTEYVGQCPGTVYYPDKIKARFISASNPPAPQRRVIIKNLTEGMNNDPYPYTDREYSNGQYSESFNFSFGDKHRTQAFSVLEGQNKLEYAIREGDTVIEKGALTAEVTVKDLGVFPRGVVCSDRESCHDETYDDDDDDDNSDRHRHRRRRSHTHKVCHTVNVCSCP